MNGKVNNNTNVSSKRSDTSNPSAVASRMYDVVKLLNSDQKKTLNWQVVFKS